MVIAVFASLLIPAESQSFVIGAHAWKITTVGSRSGDRGIDFVFSRNEQHILRISASDLGTAYAVATRCWYPAPWPVFVVSAHSYAGHGLTTWFFAVQDGTLKRLLTIEGEKGGPVFRDVDNDGTMEWFFDDYDWYSDDQGPNNYLCYKVDGDSLAMWKTFPNPTHSRLVVPWYRREWESPETS